MNNYTDTMLQQLKICGGCKKAYYLEPNQNTCEKCKARGKEIREASKAKRVPCAKPECKFKRSKENQYCNVHQLCVFIDETRNLGKKVCVNHIRGCREQLPLEYLYSRCPICLENDRANDHARRDFAESQHIYIDQNSIQTLTTNICTVCCGEYPIQDFIGEKEKYTKSCIRCRNDNKLQDSRRDRDHRNQTVRNHMKPQYTSYSKCAKERNLDFHITYNEYTDIVKNVCHYCNIIQERGFNGIDRLDSSIGYHITNCVSCCSRCNYMKGTLSKNVYLCRAEHILTYHKKIDGTLFPEYFADHIRITFSQYMARAIQKNIEFSITDHEYFTITNEPCYICGKENTETNKNGIDRYDNSKGYTIENSRSCCAECNCMKLDYTFDEIMNKFLLIYNKHKNRQFIIDENLRCNRFTIR
jgi:hypothetical protein